MMERAATGVPVEETVGKRGGALGTEAVDRKLGCLQRRQCECFPRWKVELALPQTWGLLMKQWLGISPAEADEVSILRTSEYRVPRNSGISSGSSP